MNKPSARERILAAAAQLSHDCGASNLSLDAIAAEAGVSKGGLLYHFPSKVALMRALVTQSIEAFEGELEEASRACRCGDGETFLSAYVRLSVEHSAKKKPDPAGMLVAMAEDPELLKPIKDFKRRLLDRLAAGPGDNATAIITYLALEGLFNLKIFDLDVLTDKERSAAYAAMCSAAR